LLVLRPGSQMIPGMEYALLAGLFYGAFLTASRWLANLADPRNLVITQLAVGALVLSPMGLGALPAIDARIAVLTTISAAASMLGNLILLYAYRLAPATGLAPLVYLQLIAATVLGWLVFADIPDLMTWVGAALIVGAGIVAARAR
ncbi:MAG: DMT family transporter, partial [Pseudomonadota bacterium]